MDLTQKEIRAQKGRRGDVRALCIHDKRLGRASNVAEIYPGMPMEPQSLPPLHDAQLTGMSTMGYTSREFEIIDGTGYAQSWWRRVQ
ncbi:hypothetical protein D0O09_30670 [Pseudomonas putida]|nr:hypothetical protein D0O09_30670 [Pseudomonas putida]